MRPRMPNEPVGTGRPPARSKHVRRRPLRQRERLPTRPSTTPLVWTSGDAALLLVDEAEDWAEDKAAVELPAAAGRAHAPPPPRRPSPTTNSPRCLDARAGTSKRSRETCELSAPEDGSLGYGREPVTSRFIFARVHARTSGAGPDQVDVAVEGGDVRAPDHAAQDPGQVLVLPRPVVGGRLDEAGAPALAESLGLARAAGRRRRGASSRHADAADRASGQRWGLRAPGRAAAPVGDLHLPGDRRARPGRSARRLDREGGATESGTSRAALWRSRHLVSRWFNLFAARVRGGHAYSYRCCNRVVG
jgi:hypothetical protein